MASPLGFLKMPMIEKINPRGYRIQQRILRNGMKLNMKLISASTKPAVPRPLDCFSIKCVFCVFVISF